MLQAKDALRVTASCSPEEIVEYVFGTPVEQAPYRWAKALPSSDYLVASRYIFTT
jgi:hypothetical protein